MNYISLHLLDFNEQCCWPLPTLLQFQLTELEKTNQVLEYDTLYSEKLSLLMEEKIKETQINDAITSFLFLYLGISESYTSANRIGMKISVTSQLPCGAGLGSSSSYAVSLAGTLSKAFGLDLSLQHISDWAFQIDKIFHGKPSGIDNSICTFGGGLLFRQGKIQDSISSVSGLSVILVNTKVKRSTKKVVQISKAKYERNPSAFDNIMQAIDEISLAAWNKLKRGATVDEFRVSLFIYF